MKDFFKTRLDQLACLTVLKDHVICSVHVVYCLWSKTTLLLICGHYQTTCHQQFLVVGQSRVRF